eukprot:TRINITY_DN90748_c0_g1_i1.p1 TRINITY_DN90748_c0_g1~~TRINITY_DN90748_c0_g1_i1.p1  ORF type:complete len:342 (-),score=98.26 TRINITY_DN90748_c0_g1_i1:79-1104(-)
MAIPRSLVVPVATMLVTGACNTLLMKFLVRQTASPAPGLAPTNFDYPFFQTLLMMLGELMCLGAFFLSGGAGNKAGKAPPSGIMAIPVSCDWAATTLVNAAYVMIPASTIQMCRGCIVVFTCFLSVTVLKRRQQLFQYFGVFLVAMGISIVSLEAVLEGRSSSSNLTHSTALVGIGLCLAGQIFQSSMLVIEERFLSSYTVPPLQMVGLEGFFGCLIGLVLLPALQVSGVEKSSEAMHMLATNGWVQFGCLASMCSIALFNWSGVTVTQQASAVARSTIDVSRTSIIWMVELALHWNTFSWLQLSGFVVLVLGTMVYNGILKIPGLERAEEKPLIEEGCKA